MSSNNHFQKFIKSCDVVAANISKINSSHNKAIARYARNRHLATQEASTMLEASFSEKLRNLEVKDKTLEIRKVYRNDIQNLIDNVFIIKEKCVIQ